MSVPDTRASSRQSRLRRALTLEYLTVGWNLTEGIVAVIAALAAGSVALLGFGVDSFVESASGSVMIWRLVRERRASDPEVIERIERTAQRLIGVSLALLATFIAVDAALTLGNGERPDPSAVGIAITALSLGVMWALARTKRSVAVALGSRAMEADAFQTTACWWLSLTVLVGVGLNSLFGWWWADPAAAIAMTYFIAREAKEAWEGDDCCD